MYKNYILFFIYTIAIGACKKGDSGPPEVTTLPVNVLDGYNAKGGGIITGENITGKGVCWSNDVLPDINDSKTSDGSGPENYQSDISNLTPLTSYYVRAYATTKSGTFYGEQLTFTSSTASFEQTADINGYRYKTIRIGSQTWMAENLRVRNYRDGSVIPNISNVNQWLQDTIGAMCFMNDALSTYNTFGGIYNWRAITNSRKLAPLGWHIPTQAEWDQMITFLGGLSPAAPKLRLGENNYWSGAVSNNQSGFSAIPGGYRSSGYYENFLSSAAFWAASTGSETGTRHYSIFNTNVGYNLSYYADGFSIRCIKD